MQSRKKAAAVLAAVNALSFGAAIAQAADYTWVPFAGGTYTWTNPANWTSGAPGSPAYPHEVIDVTLATVNDSANISGPVTGSNLNIVIPAGSVGVTTLTLGATGAPFNVDVGNANSGGGILFLGQTRTDGVSTVSVSSAAINSLGVPGGVNIIGAPLQLNGNAAGSVNVTGTNPLNITGGIILNDSSHIINNALTGGTLTYSGVTNLYDVTVPLTSRNMSFNGAANTTTLINGTFLRGDGTTTGNTGVFALTGGTLTTFVLNAAQTINQPPTLNKVTWVVNNNAALGTGTSTANSSGNDTWGSEIQSTDDARVLPVNFAMSQAFAVTGTNSLTIDGFLIQNNNRAFGNNLAPGKTLTLSGAGNGVSIYIFNDNDANVRNFIFDGTGNTVVNGQIKNNNLADTQGQNIIKQGSGTVTFNNTTSTYSGNTTINGGLLQFGANGAWGQTAQIIVNNFGGTWYVPGTADATGFNAFLTKIVSTSTGALEIPASESATNFNFTAGNLVNAAQMSIGAQGNVTYTGTVTPGANGYSWGGMTGVLTLGANKSVGANNVRYANGGTVILTGNQSYTGITTIQGGNLNTAQVNIANKTGASRNTQAIATPTNLVISSIANGGAASPLGQSTSDATNLVFNGGALRYTGAAGSTDRLFSVATFGATIDNSGTGPLTFTNPGSNVSFGNGNRILTLTGSNTGDNSIAGTLADAGAGSVLSVAKTGAGKWILAGNNTLGGSLTVNGGTLVMTKMPAGNATITSGRLQITTKGTANSAAGTSVVPSLTIAAGGVVDLTNNSAVINYSGDVGTLVSTVRGHLQAGRLLTTATVPANTRLGYANNATLATPFTSFGGVSVDNDSILIKFTYSGDADLDGDADGVDIGTWATNFSGELSGGAGATLIWGQGDWDYDGDVDGVDAGLWATAFTGELSGGGLGSVVVETTNPGAASVLQGLGVTVVPEPASVALLGGAIAGCSLKRRRRR